MRFLTGSLLALTLVFWDPLARFLAWCVLMLAGARPEWPALFIPS
mgnify:CR=1 FL=1